MSDKCPKCKANMIYETMARYDEEGNPEWEKYLHKIDGKECLESQLAAKDKQIAEFGDLGACKCGRVFPISTMMSLPPDGDWHCVNCLQAKIERLKKPIADYRVLHEKACKACIGAACQLAAKDEEIERLQEEAKYKCYCCQEQADEDGVCSDGCRCSSLPSWLDAREAAEAVVVKEKSDDR